MQVPKYLYFIPKSVLKKLDAFRRAFFQAAEETCTGAQCLVAWKNVCKHYFFGGLGLKNLHTQNLALLMKFAVKTLSHETPHGQTGSTYNTQMP